MRTVLLTVLILGVACTTPESHPPRSAEPSSSAEPGADYDPESRLADLGITLPEPGSPVAVYVNAVRTGDLLFLAGKGPSLPEGGYVTGKVGRDLSIEEGYEAARLTAIQHLAVLEAELGDLRRVRRLVRVTGLINCTDDFTDQSAVMNGYSDLMGEVFGDRGLHARAAVGTNALPMGFAVEVTAVVQID